MNFSDVSLTKIRIGFEALHSASAQRRWLEALSSDPRRGARSLANTLERRVQASQREAQRLARMWSRQRALHAEGLSAIAGVDEVGVGPLAGPVVAAAVILDPDRPIAGLTDSKKLSSCRRAVLEVEIKTRARAWSIAESSHHEVDEINILQASLLAMKRAVLGLDIRPELSLVDGNQLPQLEGYEMQAIVRGDLSQPCISAASILAKQYRDRQMLELDRRYPQYQFARHKGYPTALHRSLLQKHGVSPVHRRSFKPVRDLM